MRARYKPKMKPLPKPPKPRKPRLKPMLPSVNMDLIQVFNAMRKVKRG